jgi:hypothetical protein
MVGKYRWSRQQDMTNTNNQFYLVTIRGFSNPQSFKLTELQWAGFFPLAVEVKK